MRVNADEDPISAQELAELRKRLKLSPHQTEIVTHVVHDRAELILHLTAAVRSGNEDHKK